MLVDGPDNVPEFLRFVGNVLKVFCVIASELSGATVKSVETAAKRPYPQHASRVLEQRPNTVVAQAVEIIRVVLVCHETVAIVPIEPIVGAKPHETIAILQDAVHSAMGEPVLDGDAGKSQI
jgi:hypothetical protein